MAVKPILSESDPVGKIKGVGPAYEELLSHLGIKTVSDLLFHFPRRYLDYTRITTIKNLSDKDSQVIKAELNSPSNFRTGSGKIITTAVASDDTGKVKLYWFNNSYIKKKILPGKSYFIAGRPSHFNGQLTFVAPQIELDNGQGQLINTLLPVYPLTENLTHNWLRHKIQFILNSVQLHEPLPDNLKPPHYPGYHQALYSIHFPKNKNEKNLADERLAFNRHLATNIFNLTSNSSSDSSPALQIIKELHQNVLSCLPFTLTDDQTKAIKASYKDLAGITPSHRLIQGETGSGKTIVIFFISQQVLANGFSLCLLAPTQLLAEQHYQSFLKFGLRREQLTLVTANNKLTRIPNQPQIFIGTHALLTQLPSKLKFPLAAIAIDEQHKFGVAQREALMRRRPTPHLFNLSATPIPRTLALGFLGDISISTIKNKPLNRQKIKTWIVDLNHYRSKGTAWITNKLKQNTKIFVVCPAIKGEGKASTESYFRYYRQMYSPVSPVFLIHGQLKPEVVSKTLEDFRKAKNGILVATTVIEVGIDIPEAEVIIIHGAELFGLATLHQLRGRIGRNDKTGYCFLVPQTTDKNELSRLKLLEKYDSGLILAKKDVKLRGAGEVFGEKQHGWLPVRLKHFWDAKLYRQSKTVARKLISTNPAEARIIAERLISW